MRENHGKDRIQFMHNYFVLLGPKDGEKFNDLSEALNKINNNNYKFVSRGDDSGTNKKELSLWKEEGITPSKDWYLSSGNGMAETLNIASEKNCYTLTDIATYLHLEDKLDLEIKIGNDESLINEYSVITISPDKNKMINYTNAKIFMEWIVSDETKKMISTFGVKEFDRPLFIVE